MRFKILYILILSTLVTIPACSNKTKVGGTITIYSNEVIASLDPAVITDRYSGIVAKSVYEGLYSYHYLKHTIAPSIAENMPEHLGDFKYKIKLRNDVYFADDPCFKKAGGKGRLLVAQDFIYSLKRLLSSPTNTAAVIITTDIVDGASEFKKKLSKEIKGVTAPNEQTIIVQLKKFSSFFPDVFALVNTFIVPKEAVDFYGDDFAKHPVGTGAFYLSENIAPTQYILKKNSNYYGTYPSDGDISDEQDGLLNYKGIKLPLVDQVTVNVINEDKARWDAFNKGEIDVITMDKDSYFDAFTVSNKLNKTFKDKGVNVHKITELDIKYIGFNMSDPKVAKNKYLRQAISLAYDGYKHAALFYNNQALVANWILPPGLFGFDLQYKNPYRTYNIDKAKELLKKAGYPKGIGAPTLTLFTTNSIAAKQISETFSKAISEIGITIKIQQFDYATFLKKMNSKIGYQLATLQWRADLPFAEDFLRILYGKAASPGPNRSLFNDPQYNAMYEEILTLRDSPEKIDLINKIRELAAEECPVVPLVVPYRLVLTQSRIRNYKGTPLDDYDLKYLGLDK
jgi:oligopeptide transport system substrate-binding protein